MIGEACTDAPVGFVYDHTNDPSTALSAYRLPSFDPTYTTAPSCAIEGVESTPPNVANVHSTAPSVTLKAYTL